MAEIGLCSVEGCNRNSFTVGLCRPHYDLKRRPHHPRHITIGCLVIGCKNKHIARGLCDTHYKKWYYIQHPKAKWYRKERNKKYSVGYYSRLDVKKRRAELQRQKYHRTDYYRYNRNWHLNYDKTKRNEERRLCINHYSAGNVVCVHCGKGEYEFLCIDHITDNGKTHRKKLNLNGSGITRWLVKNNFPKGFQILCHTCNHLKELNRLHKIRLVSDSCCLSRQYHQNMRLRVISHYSNGTLQCGCIGCNENRLDALAIDHINGGGKRHIQSKEVSGNLYSWLIRNKYPTGYRVLCTNCNCAKGFYGYCPHEKMQKESNDNLSSSVVV